MRLKKLEWQNIGSFGNVMQSVEFGNVGGLYMVLGKNGNGKSTFLNLPKILYYGKLDKFKKEDIANRINKHGYIRGEVEVNPTTTIMIERRIAPTSLYVEKNGIDIGKAGITDYQSYIDNEVTGLPYNIFSNIISLSINDFKSFISMTPNDKRIIIDKLFAMEVINKMNELVKKDLRDIKFNMDMFDREIKSIKHNIDVALKELQVLKLKTNEDNTHKVAEITAKLTEYKPKLEEAYAKRTEYTNKKDEITASYNIFIQQKSKLGHQIKQIQDQIKLYEQDKCPTCATPFSELRFELLKEQMTADMANKTQELETIKLSESSYKIAFDKLSTGLTSIQQFIIQYETAFKTLNNELKRLNEDKPNEFQSIQNIISKNSEVLRKKEDDKNKFDDSYKYIAMLEQLYSDTGIKKKILENYLPTLNREIDYTLHELHFPYNLTFNSDFEPEMQHLGIDISVDTLSTGEKKSVDLAVLISIIRMLKRKYPELNIFMLDEVLSSLDSDKIYDVIGTLQKTAKELNMHIFIINHSPLPIEYFDYRIEIEKNAGFSSINLEVLDTMA
jgi:DNA repair exonuclease SbcCD ATPase subunit